MKYIFLGAGKGTRLQPLTFQSPKVMFKLNADTTLIQRMISLIRVYDRQADIIIVTGYMHEIIEESLDNVTFIYNPFYEVTNSIASLWFAQDHLNSEEVVIINGDVAMSELLMKEIVCSSITKPEVLLDSSIKTYGDYNVQVSGEKVLVMSKDLTDYYGEYAGVTRLDLHSAQLLKKEINHMIEDGYYDQWYENALVQMIFNENFNLFFCDVCDYDWTELDSVNDLIYAKNIFINDCKNI